MSPIRHQLYRVALRLWRTDEMFTGWPYGPPNMGFRNALAWHLYHWAIRERRHVSKDTP